MITNILSNNYSCELLYYLFEQPNKKFSITKLKEKTGFSNKGIYKGIKTLLSYSIIVQNNNKYELNADNGLTHDLMIFFKEEKSKFKFITTKSFLQIKKIMKFLEDKYFEEVYLFGSFSRGTQRVDSDIDIAIFSKDRIDTSMWQLNLEQKNIPVEFHYFNKKDKKDSLQKEIFEDGILLMKKS